jgi:glycosyltransferase involved in cell wall biosynthesis
VERVLSATLIADRPASRAVEPIASAVVAYPAPPGVGGLGHHAGSVLASLEGRVQSLRRFGPRRDTPLPFGPVPAWRRQLTWLRYLHGRYQYAMDRRFGQWLASQLEDASFDRGYFFTQIAAESLAIGRQSGAKTILDNPNGHIRDFREKLVREFARWTDWPYWGHPTEAMVRRVEREYDMADWIRVSSRWAKESLVARGVDAAKVVVIPQTIDAERFRPAPVRAAPTGPLRVVFVGSFTLGKGFQYLLRAVKRAGTDRFSITMVGATGDPWCRRLLTDLSHDIQVEHHPGDPLAAYQNGEVFVFPTVHDGFGLVVAEAMACGLPVITTDCCGAADAIEPGRTGWVIPEGHEDAVLAALEAASSRRGELAMMGARARDAAVRLYAGGSEHRLASWIEEVWH